MTRVRTLRTLKKEKASSRFSAKPSPPRYDQLPAAKDRLWRRNRELTVLNAVASAACHHLELKTVLYVALKETLALMRVGGGIIYLYDKASHRLAPAAHRGVSAALLRELLSLRLGESFSGAVAASRKPLVIPDFRKDARLRGTPSSLRGLCAYVGVPILSRRKVLGVFALLDRKKDRFTKEDVALVGLIANQVGVAIENALLYEEVRSELAARRQAEAALRESEERFRAVFQHAAAGIALVTFRHRILHTNVALQEMLGYTADELRGKSFAAITQPDDLKASMRLFKAAIAGRRSRVQLEKRLFRKDGRTVWTALNCHLHRDAAGKPLFMISLFENITERKRMEAALRQERDRAEQYFDIAGVILLVLGADQRVAMINRKGQQVLGYSARELVGRNWFDVLLPAHDRERVRAVFFQLMAGEIKAAGHFENAIVTKAGKQRTVAWHNTVLRDERGNITGVLASGEDITDLRKKEESLRESEERFRTLFRKAPIGVATYDAQGRYMDANDAYCGMLGYSKEELLRKTILDVTHPDDRPLFRKAHADVLAGLSSSYSADRRYVRKDGSFLFGRITVQIVRDPESRFLYGIGMLEDVTARKRAEERLKIYQERLRSLASQLALAEERERRRIATALHDEVGQSLALARLKLGELAGVSRRAGIHRARPDALRDDRANPQAHALADLRAQPAGPLRTGARRRAGLAGRGIPKQHPIRWEFRAERLDHPLENDVRVTLFQGARELLFNAVKHARAETVTVLVECDPAEVRIRVEDDGVGFAADELWSNPKAMTGFGLFSVRERLESLGGRLEIEFAARRRHARDARRAAGIERRSTPGSLR